MGPAAFAVWVVCVVIVQAPWGEGGWGCVVTLTLPHPTACMDSFAGKVWRGLLSFIPPIEVFDGGAMPLLR